MRKVRILLDGCITVILFSFLVGCTSNRWLSIDAGRYNQGGVRGKDQVSARRVIKQLEVDREEKQAVLTLADGSKVKTKFERRDQSGWPEGCPTNIFSHKMEVLSIEQNPLTIGEMSIANPILVRNCPREPNQVVLREDGDIGNARGYSGTACSWAETCIFFNHQQDLQ